MYDSNFDIGSVPAILGVRISLVIACGMAVYVVSLPVWFQFLVLLVSMGSFLRVAVRFLWVAVCRWWVARAGLRGRDLEFGGLCSSLRGAWLLLCQRGGWWLGSLRPGAGSIFFQTGRGAR
jgi:hypothetical protein